MRTSSRLRRFGTVSLGAFTLALGACQGGPGLSADVLNLAKAGEFGVAREIQSSRMTADKEDRNYILDRLGLTILTLADGQPASAELASREMFTLLRTQGLNEDKTVASVVLNEGVRTWKGEPFEQAMAFHYVSLTYASMGDWGNARAAASNALFLLKDFGVNEKGERLSTEQIAQNAARVDGPAQPGARAGENLTARSQRRERRSRNTPVNSAAPTEPTPQSPPNPTSSNPASSNPTKPGYLDQGYQPVETNFALGYFMVGVSAWNMGERGEATDNFAKAVRYSPGLADVVNEIVGERANTVFVVDVGRGPRKESYGTDNAFAKFVARENSVDAPMTLALAGGAQAAAPVAQDLNRLAADHMWNNLEDVRSAKMVLGNVLLGAAAVTAVSSDDEGAQWAALGMAIGGALMKAGAAADLRHAQLLPQRVHVAALSVPSAGAEGSAITLAPAGVPAMTLVNVRPPADSKQVQVRYVRFPFEARAEAWMSAGRVRWAHDGYDAPVEGQDLPYILGGRCVRTPSERSLSDYQRAGHLQGFTVVELENLYREEGLLWTVEDQRGYAGAHVLEGGRSLVAPQPGTAGYTRLFAGEHRAYKPRSPRVKELADQIRAQREQQAPKVEGGVGG